MYMMDFIRSYKDWVHQLLSYEDLTYAWTVPILFEMDQTSYLDPTVQLHDSAAAGSSPYNWKWSILSWSAPSQD